MSVHLVSRSLRRAAAAVLLPCVMLVFAAPLPAHERGPDADCHQTAAAGPAVSSGPSSLPGCDHKAGTACAAMLGCVVLPSALASVATRFSALGATTVVAPFTNGALQGRLGIGPPTPPPNS